MQLLALLMPLLGLVALVGFVWLLVVAFRQSALWGIGVLVLSPITAIFFAVKYWQESKKPFLIYIGSSTACLLIMLMMFNSLGGFEMLGMASRMQQGEEISDEDAMKFMEATMERMESSGLLSDQEKADLEQMKQEFNKLRAENTDPDIEESAFSNPSATPPQDTNAASQQTPAKPSGKSDKAEKRGPRPSATGHIAVSEARHFVGSRVRVIDHNEHERKGTIMETSPNKIVLIRYLPSGTLTYEVRTSEIASLQVLRY